LSNGFRSFEFASDFALRISDFPMTFIIETEIPCPWCGEYFPTTVDTSQGDYTTIEDCAVCCRPIALTIACEPGELADVQAERA